MSAQGTFPISCLPCAATQSLTCLPPNSYMVHSITLSAVSRMLLTSLQTVLLSHAQGDDMMVCSQAAGHSPSWEAHILGLVPPTGMCLVLVCRSPSSGAF